MDYKITLLPGDENTPLINRVLTNERELELSAQIGALDPNVTSEQMLVDVSALAKSPNELLAVGIMIGCSAMSELTDEQLEALAEH